MQSPKKQVKMYLTPSKYLSNIHVIKSIMEGTSKQNIQRLPYLYTIDERTLEVEVIYIYSQSLSVNTK